MSKRETRTRVAAIVLLASLTVIMFAGLGCQSDEQRLAAAQVSVDAGNQLFYEAMKSGAITAPKTIKVVKTALDEANALVTKADDARHATTQPAALSNPAAIDVFHAWVERAEDAYAAFEKIYAAAKAEKATK